MARMSLALEKRPQLKKYGLMRLDFSLKEPKERTLEERQREMREDFQAGRSVEAIVAVAVGVLDPLMF